MRLCGRRTDDIDTYPHAHEYVALDFITSIIVYDHEPVCGTDNLMSSHLFSIDIYGCTKAS